MSRLVVGVIGHVDHGKTALVRALTGMQTDRLPEERRRGISIALGFAHMAVEGAAIDLIDMPGHEDFIRTMVSGATGIDAVLLVVAANEGIKPQTREHINIAGLLGVRRAVVAVAKADLATPEPARTVAREAQALASAAGLTVTGTAIVSAITGAGIGDLARVLAAVVRDLPPPDDAGFPYLAVDRAFSVAGHGTVVTGTLRRGALAVGDEIEILPAGLPARVRGLQVHNAGVAVAGPGQRVAVNLRGVEPAQVGRGSALSARGLLSPATWLSVSVRAVDGAALATTARLRLLVGTAELDVRLRLLADDALEPGATTVAQLRCAIPVTLPAGEHFILRTASPPLTVAGGRVLDPEAVRMRRRAPAILERLLALAALTPEGIVARAVLDAGMAGVALPRLARIGGVAPARAAGFLQALPVLIGRSRVAVSRAAFEALLARIPACLAASEAAHPAGLSRERLAALLPEAGAAVLDDAVALLTQRGALRQSGGSIRLADAAREHDQARREAAEAALLAEALRHAGLTPPDAAQVAPGPQARRLLDRLVREGVAVRAVDHVQKREILFHREAVETAQRLLAPALAQAPGLLVKEAGAMLGISRKYSVPLLEYLDSIRFTRRVADRRMLGHPR